MCKLALDIFFLCVWLWCWGANGYNGTVAWTFSFIIPVSFFPISEEEGGNGEKSHRRTGDATGVTHWERDIGRKNRHLQTNKRRMTREGNA